MLDPLEKPQVTMATEGRHRFGMGDADPDWTGSALEPDRERMLALGGEALQFVTDFIASRATAPASPLEGAAELANDLRGGPPDAGRPFGELLDVLEQAATRAVDTTGLGYLGYIPAGGLYSAALADFLACAVNRYVGLAGFAPALVQMEVSVLRWLADLFGLPASARGIFTSGGSLAHFSALVAAREARLGERFADGTLYVSEEGHHSVAKAARLAGFPTAAVRRVPCTPDLRMDIPALKALLHADRIAGRRPFLLVATAGTTGTGAIDPLTELAELALQEGLWLHIDAAYGGMFRLTARGQERLAGVEAADSIVVDPHKGLFLPYGTGALLLREGANLRAAHHHDDAGAYLQDLDDPAVLPNFSEYSPELTRDFRGLRLWLPLHLHGVAAFRAALDEKLDLARLAYEALREIPGIEVPWEPALSIVAFRPRYGGEAAGRRLLEQLNASQRVFLSSTTAGGHFVLRFAVLSVRTHRARVEEAIELVRQVMASLAADDDPDEVSKRSAGCGDGEQSGDV